MMERKESWSERNWVHILFSPVYFMLVLLVCALFWSVCDTHSNEPKCEQACIDACTTDGHDYRRALYWTGDCDCQCMGRDHVVRYYDDLEWGD